MQGDGIDLSLLTSALSPQENVSTHMHSATRSCRHDHPCSVLTPCSCLLCALLLLSCQVSELDQLWEFDQLFADVSSEMLAEMEPTEKEEGEEEEDDENAGVARGDGKKAHTLRNRGNKAVEVEA